MANRRYIDFPIASSVGDSDIILIWQSGANKQTTKATFLSGLPENLDELNDVAISGLTNGQILRYDSVTGKWENTDQGNLDLNDLNDVSIVSPSNGQVLVYNSSTSKWENSSGGYVPYTGAVTTVNLGAQTIQAGSFVKAGGTAAQFLKADGSVDSNTYGTGTVTSVALTMPSAFSVANSPITTAGTLAVTGAGTVGQYIRGDGSLADFPESSGGGSSVSYYLNGSVAQGTIGGVAYKELNKVPVLGAGTDFTINADGYIASFITDAGDPNLLEIPGGNWNFETYFSASSSGGTPSFYVELYKVNSGGTATLIASNSGFPELIAFGTNIISYFSTLAVPTTALALTDRLAIRYYVTHSGRTITLHTEDNHLCQIVTTFTTGITALNGLTAQVQNFAVGTSGTDFAIASATATHTFNLPTASATNRGALSSSDWTTFNNKTSNLGTVTSVGLSSATSGVTIGSTPVTTSGTITLAIATASGSQNGLLSSTDWTTFNSKQNALTNPVTGTGSTNYLPKFTGSTTIGNSLFTDNGTHGAIGGANYQGGTDVRSFNISAPLYAGLGFWANNQGVANIFGYGVTGNLILTADPSNIFSDSKIILSVDGTDRLAVFNNGNVSIANSPTDASFKLDVNGTGRFSGNLTCTSATFSGTITSLKTSGEVFAATSATTGSLYQRFQNSGSQFFFGIDNSTGSDFGGGNYSANIYSGSNVNLNFATNNAIRLTVSGGGNVGIGTASPLGPLEVRAANRSVSTDGILQINTTNSQAIDLGGSLSFGGMYQNSGTTPTEWAGISGRKENSTNSNYAGYLSLGTRPMGGVITERMRITSGGNVGIGVIPSAWDNTIFRPLQIGASGSFLIGRTDAISQTQLGANAFYDGNWKYVISTSANASRYYQSGGEHVFESAGAGTSGNNITWSPRMTITLGGNVLLGTTTDIGERLTLNGRIGIVGATVASGNTRSFFVRGSQNVADGGTLSINVTNTALIFIAENNTGTGALFFLGYASSTITKISDPSNMFDVADTAGKLCIFKSAVSDVATVKNRLGSTRNITVSYIGVSD